VKVTVGLKEAAASSSNTYQSMMEEVLLESDMEHGIACPEYDPFAHIFAKCQP
jgi:hypothetical protein